MKYLNFTYKREATILAIMHVGLIGVGIVFAIAIYLFGSPK